MLLPPSLTGGTSGSHPSFGSVAFIFLLWLVLCPRKRQHHATREHHLRGVLREATPLTRGAEEQQHHAKEREEKQRSSQEGKRAKRHHTTKERGKASSTSSEKIGYHPKGGGGTTTSTELNQTSVNQNKFYIILLFCNFKYLSLISFHFVWKKGNGRATQRRKRKAAPST